MLLKKSQTKIKLATQILRASGLIAFPTDTVYELGADACNPAAMAKIFALKNRPFDRPLAVLIFDIKQLWPIALIDLTLSQLKILRAGAITEVESNRVLNMQ